MGGQVTGRGRGRLCVPQDCSWVVREYWFGEEWAGPSTRAQDLQWGVWGMWGGKSRHRVVWPESSRGKKRALVSIGVCWGSGWDTLLASAQPLHSIPKPSGATQARLYKVKWYKPRSGRRVLPVGTKQTPRVGSDLSSLGTPRHRRITVVKIGNYFEVLCLV